MQWPRDTELFSLDQLAHELGVHPRTLRAAARTGHLAVHLYRALALVVDRQQERLNRLAADGVRK